MTIEWLGHACFRISSAASRLVIDPYEDHRVPGLDPLRTEAEAVYCSHGHGDHNAVSCVNFSGCACDIAVETIDSYHDDKLGLLRGKNTIHLLSADGLRLAHLGDLGHIPGKKTLEKLQDLDALLIPVGGHYTIDAPTAQKLIGLLRPRVVIPMHYRIPGQFGYEEIAELGDFLALRPDVEMYEDHCLELTKETPAQTAVLCYRRP